MVSRLYQKGDKIVVMGSDISVGVDLARLEALTP